METLHFIRFSSRTQGRKRGKRNQISYTNKLGTDFCSCFPLIAYRNLSGRFRSLRRSQDASISGEELSSCQNTSKSFLFEVELSDTSIMFIPQVNFEIFHFYFTFR